MRTYSGHTSARASNELYRKNLAKGQTGLSIAFDLPTQTGYDSDHPLARGEVGKVGVPISSIEDMAALLEGIPLEEMNTSMTINATAAWLLSLYVALAKRRGVDAKLLEGTTQNDIIKEYLSRGTHIFPPKPSLRLIGDMVSYTVEHIPKWNPINICSYHLQEAGATPVQEFAFALADAICVLDTVRAAGAVSADEFPRVFGRISFFVNAGVRFVEEMCKMRAFTELWDEIGRERYGVADEKLRRFRYGVQVNSLGLTEAQPENNVQRIVLEMLGGRAFEERARPLRAASGLERSARPAAAVGPAVVVAHPTGHRLRERSPRARGSLRRVPGRDPQGRRAEGGRARGAREGRRHGRSARRRRERVSEAAARRVERAAPAPHRIRRADRGRREPVHGDRAESAARRRASSRSCRVDPAAEREQVERASRLPRSAERGGSQVSASPAAGCGRERAEHHARIDRLRRGRRDHRRVGRRAADGLRRVSRPDRNRRGGGDGRRRRSHRRDSREARGNRARARPQAPHAGRQAGPRRALERRRTDRAHGPRRRLRGHLRGHPLHSRADRAG